MEKNSLDEILGEQFVIKYKDIYAILRLIYYRTETRGKEGIFSYDGDYSDTYSVLIFLKSVRKSIVYLVKYFFHKRARKPQAFLSDTFLTLDRYDEVMSEIMDTQSVCASFTVKDCGLRNIFGLNGLNKRRMEKRTVFLGSSVAGYRLKRAVEKWFEFLLFLIDNGETCSMHVDKTGLLLEEISKETNKRICKIVKVLKREQVNLFITINQYNLKDLLLIIACRKLNIVTKELYHCSNCVVALPDKGKRMLDNYTDELCAWNLSELRYIEKYITIVPILNNCKVTITGSPELSYYYMTENMKKYKKRDAIILFVPTYPIFLKREYRDVISEEDRQYLRGRKRAIFDGIHTLASREGLDVYLRYHPIEPEMIVEDDREIANLYSFNVLSKSREDLIKGLCWSKYAFSCMSSVLLSALAYKCECYS